MNIAQQYGVRDQLSTEFGPVREAGRGALKEALLVSAILLLVSRFALWLVTYLVGHYFPGQAPVGALGALSDAACQWDCGWYVSIIQGGYSSVPIASQPGATNYAFFPLYPLMVKALAYLTGLSPIMAGLVISNAAFFLGLTYIYRLVIAQSGSRQLAQLTVTIICVLPGTFVFSAVYTESTFLLCLAASMFYWQRGEYCRAGLAAAALSAVRSNGVLLIVYFVAWIWRRYGLSTLLRPWQRAEAFIPIVLAPLGLFLFWAYCYFSTGDAFAQATTAEAGWNWRWGVPFYNLWQHFSLGGEARFWAVGGFLAFLCSLLLVWQKRYEEFLFCAAVFLLIFGSQIPQSLLRYSIPLFPIWVGLADAIRRREVLTYSTLSLLATLSGCLMVAWVLSLNITV